MSALAPDPERQSAAPGSASPQRGLSAERALEVCPLLRSVGASWSSVYASRDLYCWAVSPPAGLTVAKQRMLCATASHVTCATYLAASAADPALRESDPGASLLWPATTSVPVVLEPPRRRAAVAISVPRAAGQALLVALMLVAFVVIAIAKNGPLGGGSAVPAPTLAPTAAMSAAVAASPSPSRSPEPSAAPTPTVSPSAAGGPSASPSPPPSASPRRYKVRSGDTLAVIAAKFHTTVKAIVAANGIVDPRTIHAGQTLIIP